MSITLLFVMLLYKFNKNSIIILFDPKRPLFILETLSSPINVKDDGHYNIILKQ